ncbi:hypothetical protein Q9295_09995 [Xinfangfangia sp. CPCC 101601]|uniref:Uncharacterized protein n=1 Tax=Pseudogemmobacter lacusdianii TaxID=3069608 RepID=A0ABU0VY98_9RHOB|nr:hypothetical protein [Xinfangfangia sp. CPCC 101601]MDQ2066708.1 hypothetical protein [Xinfangfangia sp. CPCC 101601]
MTAAPQRGNRPALVLGRAAPVPLISDHTCAVGLIDRRTGRPHRINGQPVVLYTKKPAAAVAKLLSGRDVTVWEARVDLIET